MDNKLEELLKQIAGHADELMKTAKRCEAAPDEKCPTNVTERALAAKLGVHLLRESLGTERAAPVGKVEPDELGKADEE